MEFSFLINYSDACQNMNIGECGRVKLQEIMLHVGRSRVGDQIR
jgi:hypothetical protein